MTDFALRFDLSACYRLDEFALLARQDYNFGNGTDWFGAFRGGLNGFYARIYGVKTHYESVHAWLQKLRTPSETEFHLASIFFNMDSAVECFTFALNALGYAASPSSFQDVTSVKGLALIRPSDILGFNPATRETGSALDGYALIFPRLQAYWQSNAELLSIITNLHDVSKHRQTIYTGGMMRSDPPAGFYEALGISDNSLQQSWFRPMAEIILVTDPKAPRTARRLQAAEDQRLLESIAPQFCDFVRESSTRALEDARRNIVLRQPKFQKSS